MTSDDKKADGMNNIKTVLALSPHTDDVEFGAGGTVAKWVEAGKTIYYVAFSIAEKSAQFEEVVNAIVSSN